MRTQVLDKKAVDFMVLHYSAHDDTMLQGLGKHCKECRWKIQPSLDSPVLEIVVGIDKSMMGRPQVSISCDKEQLFPPRESNSKRQVLKEDFAQKWPFRGNAKGVNEKNFFEVMPDSNRGGQWYPATITKQRDDGRFEALVEMPNGIGGTNQMTFDALRVDNIRVASTKNAMELPERFILLEVPRDNPLLATLMIDGKELVTHYFARPTPAPKGQTRSKITCKVDHERKRVTADIGHVGMSRFLSMEPRAVKSEPGMLRHAWIVQIGPWAQHRIELEKKHRRGKVVTLSVDGEVLVEASGDDIECTADHFDCRFTFRGHRCIDWEVFETNSDGAVLKTRATVAERTKHSVDCVVSMPDDNNLFNADLWVNGVNFKALPTCAEEHPEENLSMEVQAMQLSFGLKVPYKTNQEAPSGLLGMTAKAGEHASTIGSFFGALFGAAGGTGMLSGCCKGDCNKSHEITRDIVEPPQPRY